MENIKWLWGVMDKRYHKWHILGLIISAVTSLMLLINPYLTMRLMDDVIVAQNPEPLLGLLLTMLSTATWSMYARKWRHQSVSADRRVIRSPVR